MFYTIDPDGTIHETDDFTKLDRWKEQTIVDGKMVSTVFLMSSHGLDNGRPILFETMIFEDKGEGASLDYQERYCTLQEAKEGHAKAIETVKAGKVKGY